MSDYVSIKKSNNPRYQGDNILKTILEELEKGNLRSIKREPIPHDRTGGASRQDDPFGFDWGNMDFGRLQEEMKDALERAAREGKTDLAGLIVGGLVVIGGTWLYFKMAEAAAERDLANIPNDIIWNPGGFIEKIINELQKKDR